MSAIPGSIPVTGFIAPTDTSDTYAVTDAIYGIDGLRNVDDHTERDNISLERRRAGMVVGTLNDGKYWRLKDQSWTLGDPNDWELFLSIGPSGSVINTGLKYTIEATDDITIPAETQYWIYGDIEIKGILTNYGKLTVANGNMIMNGGTFSNLNTVEFVSIVNSVIAGVGLTGGGTSSSVTLGVNTGNGLDIVNSDIVGLGGTLSQDTTIEINDKILRFIDSSITGTTISVTFDSQASILGDEELQLNVKNSSNEQSTIDILGSSIGVKNDSSNSTSDLYLSPTEVYLEYSLGLSQSVLRLTSASQSFVDQFNNKGLEYPGDYSANFTTYSLVTKGWVLGMISAGDITEVIAGTGLTGGATFGAATLSVNVDNGLSIIGSDYIGIGGTLSQDTIINAQTSLFQLTGTASSSEQFQIKSTWAPLNPHYINIGRNNATLKSEEGNSSIYSAFITSNGTLSMVRNIATQSQVIAISGLTVSSTITITDSLNNRGIEYTDDYSANFITHSLVTKGWVDTQLLSVGSEPVYTQRGLTTAGVSNLDGQSTGLTISYTPVDTQHVHVYVNGLLQLLGNGVSASVDCYFGTVSSSPRVITDIEQSDTLYWNSISSGFILTSSDRIDIIYSR